jgi:hypothetical protein
MHKRVHEMHATTISMYNYDLKDIILEVTQLDQHYLEIKGKLQKGIKKQKFQDYKLREDGIFMYKDKVYVPNFREMKNMVLKEMHNFPYVGHPGY